MARSIDRLTAAFVKSATPGKHADGRGLWLYVGQDGGAKWVQRVHIHKRRREMGLGAYPAVSLKEARERAEKARNLVSRGLDPIKERERAQRQAERNSHLLKDIAQDAFETRMAELKGDGKAGRWFSPLQLHVLPKLGGVPVADIDQRDIRDTLAPIWHDKADTARKAIQRLAIVMRHAAALGLDVDLQAVEKAKALLGAQRHTSQNIPAMPWQDVPAFYQSLDGGTLAELALRLLILTGARSAPLRNLHLDQIEGDVWTIPGEAMKGRKGATSDFRIPLSREALDVIDAAKPFVRDGFLFPGQRKGALSDMAMTRLLERRGLEARPHGFRSSLRDWIAETTNTPSDVAETVLAHTVGGATERAYRRTDFLEQRRVLLERWANTLLANPNKNIVVNF